MKYKSKITSILLAFIMVFTMTPMLGVGEVFAIEASHEGSTYAQEAPITTVTIDKSKLTKENLLHGTDRKLVYVNGTVEGKLDQNPQNNVTFSIDKDGYVYAESIPVNADYKWLGNFTLVYKDAAIMSDGTKQNLEVIFDELYYIRSNNYNTYHTKARIAFAGDVENGTYMPLALTPACAENIHNDEPFAIRAEVKFRVGKGGVVADDKETFLFTANNLKQVRNSDIIVDSYGHSHYSDSILPMYGKDDESGMYLPTNTKLVEHPHYGSWSGIIGNYRRRFMKDPWNSKDDGPYNLSLALAARAGGSTTNRESNGFITRAWAAYYPYGGDQSSISFLDTELTHKSTSSSGEHGKIELWTDGEVHDTNDTKSRQLTGGTTSTPRTYSVPNGKSVTYKMTPDQGWYLDSLKVKEATGTDIEVTPQVVLNGDNVDYYLYTFDTQVTGSQEIKVTWKNGAHTWVNDTSLNQNATCTMRRLIGQKCNACGHTRQVEDLSGEGKALGHDYGNGNDSGGWKNLNSEEHYRKCIRASCGHEEVALHTWGEGVETKKATTTSEGEITYTCAVCGAQQKTQTAKLTPDPTPGSGSGTDHQHEYGNPTFTWSDDYSSCTATRTCKDNDGAKETETVKTTAVITKQPTETEPGETTYTAAFSNPAFGTQTCVVANVKPYGQAKYDDLTDTEKADADKIAEAYGVDKDTAAQMLKAGQSMDVSIDTMLLTSDAIGSLPDDSDPAGTSFSKLLARAKKRTARTMTIQWKSMSQADGYMIYSNRCGKTRKLKLKKTFTNNSVKQFKMKNLKKQKYYKTMVVAYKLVNGQKLPIAASVVVHCTTKAKKNTIAKGVSVNKKNVTVKAGESIKLKSKEIKAEKKKVIKKHRVIQYESLDPAIAKVSKKTGKITGVAAGKTTIYAYAQNGVFKKIPVTVQ